MKLLTLRVGKADSERLGGDLSVSDVGGYVVHP